MRLVLCFFLVVGIYEAPAGGVDDGENTSELETDVDPKVLQASETFLWAEEHTPRGETDLIMVL